LAGWAAVHGHEGEFFATSSGAGSRGASLARLHQLAPNFTIFEASDFDKLLILFGRMP
jgi:hypothetical protein